MAGGPVPLQYQVHSLHSCLTAQDHMTRKAQTGHENLVARTVGGWRTTAAGSLGEDMLSISVRPALRGPRLRTGWS